MLHGVRELDATIAGDSWDAICAVALTNPETLARELRLRLRLWLRLRLRLRLWLWLWLWL